MNKSISLEQYIRANTLHKLPIHLKSIRKFKKFNKVYYNYPVAFDIETSSFRDDNGEPRANMYIWQMCLGDSEYLIYGRTWDEFLQFVKVLRKTFHTSKNRILTIYVHNLAYEFQFIRKLFDWESVFSLDTRVPLYARTSWGFEFRCSYHLSGYNLATLAKNLTKHDINKLVGDLDYKKVRHSDTPLTEKELSYCMYDVKIVCAYISEVLERDGKITAVPLTKTGYVRNACRLACYGADHKESKYFDYRHIMEQLTMTTHEYQLLRCAFMGGFTHANAFAVNRTQTNVTSMDFISSYPYVMFSEQYPWSKGELCYPDVEEICKTLGTYAYIIDLEIYGCESKTFQEDFISFSRCVDCKGYILNNGRVNSAEYIHIIVTSVDFEIILKTYRFTRGGLQIRCAYKYYLSYLPTDFINEMVGYYEKKTTLKGVPGKDEEYLNSKEQLNSCYGMVVTSPVRPLITYENNEWGKVAPDLEEGVDKYNKDKRRFMPYVVGVFVTAYARRNLWDGILELDTDYVYSDTDSVKFLNYNEHKKYFEKYNKEVVNKLYCACEYHGMSIERVTPKTIKGDVKILGVWECESTTPGTPTYSRFKTLGAKRYMVEDYTTKEISLTVSGLNKKKAIPYLLNKYGPDKIFDAFTDDEYGIDNLMIPEGHSGRMVSTYIDDETQGTVTDYTGVSREYHELSSINLEESTYTLSLASDYINFLLGVQNEI